MYAESAIHPAIDHAADEATSCASYYRARYATNHALCSAVRDATYWVAFGATARTTRGRIARLKEKLAARAS